MTEYDYRILIAGILSLRTFPDRKEFLINILERKGFNWNAFIKVSSDHLVLQTLYPLLDNKGLLTYVSGEVGDHLKEIHRLSTERNEKILSQVETLNTILNNSGIAPVYLKGTGNLLDGLYDTTGDRIMSDIDLLLNETEASKAQELFIKEGFNPYSHRWEDPSGGLHLPSLHHPDFVTTMEIHINPVHLPWNRKLSTGMVLEDKQEIKGNTLCFVPSDRHKIILNFIHSQFSNQGRKTGIIALRDQYDLWKLALRCDIPEILPGLPFNRQAKAYLEATSEIFEDRLHLPVTGSLNSKLYLLHFRMNGKSSLYNRLSKFFLFLFDLIFVRYLLMFPKIIFNRKARKTVRKKISDREWYSTHLSEIKNNFR